MRSDPENETVCQTSSTLGDDLLYFLAELKTHRVHKNAALALPLKMIFLTTLMTLAEVG